MDRENFTFTFYSKTKPSIIAQNTHIKISGKKQGPAYKYTEEAKMEPRMYYQ
jgi:hypothetical protein